MQKYFESLNAANFMRARRPFLYNNYLWVFIIFVFLVYSNTFQSQWILDDYYNIVLNPDQRLVDEVGGLTKTIRAIIANDRLDRPLARLSFALNRAVGGENPWSYHLLNTLIHAMAAFVLYRTQIFLLRVRGGGKDSASKYIALFAALLWAGHPIQTQSVTYVVQRMTVLAGLFYLLGIYCFLRARGANDSAFQMGWWSGCLLSFLLAIASKENAILLPISILLIEILFFKKGNWRAILPGRKLILVWSGGLILVGGAFCLLTAGNLHLLLNYEERYFTLTERLLTQPRVLWFYLSLIAWPMPWRFSLEHDFPVSKSFLDPWSTAPALVGILFLITLAWRARVRYPLFSFGVLYYFLNQAVESTFLPLEMVFEHRNYIPSMFLFLTPASILLKGINLFKKKNIPLYPMIRIAPVLLVVALGVAAYERNLAWATPASLWWDAFQKAPRSGRAMAYLALICSENPSGFPLALRLYTKALEAEHPNRWFASEMLNNVAALYYATGNYKDAAEYWKRAAERSPDFLDARIRLSLALFRNGQNREAIEQLDGILEKDPRNAQVLNLRGKIRFETDDPKSALGDFERALEAGPDYTPAKLNIGAFHALAGDAATAQTILVPLLKHPDFGFVASLWLIVAMGDTIEDEDRLNQKSVLLPKLSAYEMEKRLNDLQRNIRIADTALLPVFDESMFRLFASPNRLEQLKQAPWTLSR